MDTLNKLFGFNPETMTVKNEVIAGVTSFLAMAYILAVNPSMFSAIMPVESVFTATALAAIVGTLVMAFYAKMPFGLAPGMGLNAFFVFVVCLTMGHTWQFALTAVFIEGLIFILLTVTNLRNLIVDSIPNSLKRGLSVGFGLFIALIGFENAHIVVSNPSTVVSLGSVSDPNVIICLIGIVITGTLVSLKIKGGMLIGIIATTIAAIPFGLVHYNGVVSMPGTLEPIFCKFEWSEIFSIDMLIVVFTFLFMDMFDTIGTIVGVITKSKQIDPNCPDYPIKKAFMADAVATVAGAMFGTCTTTTYIESAAGIAEGGRSGLTAFVIAVCFGLAMLFSPLFLAIPSAAIAPVLIIVGAFMITPIKDVDLNDMSEALPFFLCSISIPFTYSVSTGLAIGMLSYLFINLCIGKYKKLTIPMYVLSVILLAGLIFA